jgi:uncharacterized protein YqgC (DUF456 family)
VIGGTVSCFLPILNASLVLFATMLIHAYFYVYDTKDTLYMHVATFVNNLTQITVAALEAKHALNTLAET